MIRGDNLTRNKMSVTPRFLKLPKTDLCLRAKPPSNCQISSGVMTSKHRGVPLIFHCEIRRMLT